MPTTSETLTRVLGKGRKFHSRRKFVFWFQTSECSSRRAWRLRFGKVSLEHSRRRYLAPRVG